MIYQVVLLRDGGDVVETLYWNGTLEETRDLARAAAAKWDAEFFLVFDFDGSGDVIYSEQRPFGRR